MRRIAITALIALGCCVAPAAAQAGKLVLTAEGSVVEPGSVVYLTMALTPGEPVGAGDCSRTESGTMAVNGAGTDRVTFGEVVSETCEPGTTQGGTTREVKLSASGKILVHFSPDLTYVGPASCAYTVSSMRGTLSSVSPGEMRKQQVSGVAKLDMSVTPRHSPCGSHEVISAELELRNVNNGLLYSELA